MTELSQKEQALLNKIYRAVHDGVCPKCGSDLHFDKVLSIYFCDDEFCEFDVCNKEMERMKSVIAAWGKEAVEFFTQWRQLDE